MTPGTVHEFAACTPARPHARRPRALYGRGIGGAREIEPRDYRGSRPLEIAALPRSRKRDVGAVRSLRVFGESAVGCGFGLAGFAGLPRRFGGGCRCIWVLRAGSGAFRRIAPAAGPRRA